MSTLEIAGALKEMREDVPPDQIPPGKPVHLSGAFCTAPDTCAGDVFPDPGHKISMVLERDPEGGKRKSGTCWPPVCLPAPDRHADGGYS